jgi:chromosome segregation ATPase
MTKLPMKEARSRLQKHLPEPEALCLIPEAIARKYMAIPLAVNDNTLRVAMVNPEDILALEALASQCQMRIKPQEASVEEIQEAIDFNYKDYDEIERQISSISLPSETTDEKINTEDQESSVPEPTPVEPAVQQEVKEIKEAVSEAVSDTSLPDKVTDLNVMLENLSEEVEGWRAWHKDTYLEVIETLKSQVGEIQEEWNNVSSSMKDQHDKLESLLESFPGVIETSSIKALALRVTHLEKVVSMLVEEANTRVAAAGTRRQFIISITALAITVSLWVAFILLNFLS